MTQPKPEKISLDSYITDPKPITATCEYELENDVIASYSARVINVRISYQGLIGEVKITKHLKETIVNTTFFRKKKYAKVVNNKQWSINSGNVLLTNKFKPVELTDGTDNYKLNLINAGLNHYVIEHGPAGSSRRKHIPINIPAILVNKIGESLDEQLIEKYKTILK